MKPNKTSSKELTDRKQKIFVSIYLLLCLAASDFSASAQTKSDKRGMAYGYHSVADMKAVSSNVSWWYNWSPGPETAVAKTFQDLGMDFVPMTWNGAFNETAIRAFYASHPNAKFLLGFNEPNFTTQANMTPKQAAAIWPKLEKIAMDFGLKIVGPAVNYADKPVQENGVIYSDPIVYLDAFFKACPTCQVDYIAVHNYMCYAGALSDYIKKFKKYNRKIWLTEFACWDQPNITLAMQKGYMMGAIDYLESDTMVFRYSWFNGNRSQAYPYLDLFKQQSGQLTDLGKLYVGFNPIHDPNVYTAIPARLEAENYSTMSGIAIEATSDNSGDANVGWIDTNDWLEYNIEVPSDGDYNVFLRIAANASTSLQILENKAIRSTVSVPATGGWQTWKTIQAKLSLSSGKHILRIFTSKGGFNLNWLEITTENQPTRLETYLQANVKLYPNPVKNKLLIEMADISSKTEVSILDLSGRILNSQTFSDASSILELDFSSFRNGSYIVQMKNEGTVSNHLIVK